MQLVGTNQEEIAWHHGKRRAFDLIADIAGKQKVTFIKIVKMQRNVQFAIVFVVIDFIVFQQHMLSLLKKMFNAFHILHLEINIEQYYQYFKHE